MEKISPLFLRQLLIHEHRDFTRWFVENHHEAYNKFFEEYKKDRKCGALLNAWSIKFLSTLDDNERYALLKELQKYSWKEKKVKCHDDMIEFLKELKEEYFIKITPLKGEIKIEYRIN